MLWAQRTQPVCQSFSTLLFCFVEILLQPKDLGQDRLAVRGSGIVGTSYSVVCDNISNGASFGFRELSLASNVMMR